MSSMTSLILMAVLAHAAFARQAQVPVTIRTPADLSYEELVYIYKTKSGHAAAMPRVLTPCARAILGCCKDKVMNAHCSEMLQCGAHFFDNNPCDDTFIIEALNAAKIFYEQF